MKKQPINQPYMTEQWFKTLKEQCDTKTARVVAQELGYSKTTLSLILNGHYVGKTDRVCDAVLLRYHFVECPHLRKMLRVHECVSLATSPAPTHNPIKMQQWRACQNCPKCPKECSK